MGMWREVASIYRESKKKKDINWWTEWVCRPPAAVLVYALRGTRITPNQVTFLATAIAAVSAVMLVALPGFLGGILAALVFEASFVLDCVDGQLARIRRQASTIGHHLDFLMDEVKAFIIYGAVTLRLFRLAEGKAEAERALIAGLVGLACLGTGLCLTTFMRRPEYGARPPTEDGQPVVLPKRAGPLGLVIGLLERAARVVVHYPSYILLVALLGRLDVFFWVYGAVNVLYAARSFLQVFLRLGMSRGIGAETAPSITKGVAE